jgi:hypothetical protein
MRKVILLMVLLALVVFALPTQAGKVKIANTPLPVTGDVNVSTVYRFAGYSEDFTTGAAGGILHMNTKCQLTFGTDARMCTTKEFLQSAKGSYFTLVTFYHQALRGFNPPRRPLFSIRSLTRQIALTSRAIYPHAI